MAEGIVWRRDTEALIDLALGAHILFTPTLPTPTLFTPTSPHLEEVLPRGLCGLPAGRVEAAPQPGGARVEERDDRAREEGAHVSLGLQQVRNGWPSEKSSDAI